MRLDQVSQFARVLSQDAEEQPRIRELVFVRRILQILDDLDRGGGFLTFIVPILHRRQQLIVGHHSLSANANFVSHTGDHGEEGGIPGHLHAEFHRGLQRDGDQTGDRAHADPPDRTFVLAQAAKNFPRKCDDGEEDGLLTWNAAHIANAAIRRRVEGVCREQGYNAPILCTPDELMEDSDE